MEIGYKNLVKCSSCGAEAVSDNEHGFPYTCGMCGKVSMNFVRDLTLEEITKIRNKLNREISKLKKVKPKEEKVCMNCDENITEGKFCSESCYENYSTENNLNPI